MAFNSCEQGNLSLLCSDFEGHDCLELHPVSLKLSCTIVAEEKAATTKSTNIDLTSSQLTEINNSANIQATLNLMAKNAARGTTQDIALARDFDLRIDVLLIQEPWWSNRTETHPYYELNLPYGGENIRPRAATYIRKDPDRLFPNPRYPQSPTGDYCWVESTGSCF